MQVLCWVHNIENNNEDSNLGFVLFSATNGQCDSGRGAGQNYEWGAEQRYKPFLKYNNTCIYLGQKLQQKSVKRRTISKIINLL